MARIHVRAHFRNRRPVRSHTRKVKKIPRGVGTLWHDGFIHGPRIKSPSKFVDRKVFVVNRDWMKRRHVKEPKIPSNSWKSPVEKSTNTTINADKEVVIILAINLFDGLNLLIFNLMFALYVFAILDHSLIF